MSQGVTTIYALSASSNPGLARYLGKTSQSLGKRLSCHIHDSKRKRTKKSKWIKDLIKNGEKVLIWPIEICRPEEWEDREKYWIWFFNPINILNSSDGGDCGPVRRGWHHTEDAKRKISLAGIGRKRSPYAKKFAPPFKGRRHSPESRMKISLSLKGKDHWKNGVAMASIANNGKKRSEDVVRRITEANKISCSTESFREKMRNIARDRTTQKRILCLETGDVFPNVWVASDWLGGSRMSVYNSVKYGWKAFGYTFKSI